MSVHHFGSYIAIIHKALEGDSLPTSARDVSVELAIWLQAKKNEQKWRDQGTADAQLNGPRSYLSQPKMRDLAERSLVAATRGFRPPLANSAGYLTTVGSALATVLEPVLDHINLNARSSVENVQDADELFMTAALPLNVVKVLNLFYVAITKTERMFLDARRSEGDLTQFQIPGVTVLTDDSDKMSTDPLEEKQMPKNFIKAQKPAHEPNPPNESKNIIPTFVPIPTSRLPGAQATTTQHFDETSTYLMQAAVAEGSMWHAWVPVSIFAPSTRNLVRYLYRLGLVDLRAFSTQGRGRPRLIVRPSTIGEKLLRHLAQEKML